ncbi:hypothetical protein K8S19_07985 [bacterium]|nr:hypothetical protein [bacterium]
MRTLMIVCVFCALLFSCAPKTQVVINVDQAIGTVNTFFRNIMQHQYQRAYDTAMSPGIKFNPASSLEQFSADWDAIFDKYGPLRRVVFNAYQPVAGRRVIQLYYTVEHEKVVDPIVYHFVLEQNRQGAITIFMIDIGNEKPYPPHVKTPAEKQTKDTLIEILPEAR